MEVIENEGGEVLFSKSLAARIGLMEVLLYLLFAQ